MGTSVLAGLLAAILPAAAPARAAEPDRAGYVEARSRVREAYGADRPWEALPLADALAARPGLDAGQRAWALGEAARIRERIGDASGAEADLRQALAATPGDATTAFELALLLRGERPDDALRYAGQAAERTADAGLRIEALRLSGELRLDAGDAKGAVRDLALALRGDGGDLDALVAMARASRDDPAQAEAWAARAEGAARRAPEWYRGAALRASARLWRDVGDDARAAAAYERALAVDPDDLDALEGLVGIPREKRARRPAVDTADPPVPAPRPGELETLRASLDAALERHDAVGALSLADLFIEAVPRAPAWRQPDAYRWIAERLLAIGPAALARAQGASWRAYTLRTHSVAVALLLSRTRPVFPTPTAPGSPEFAGAEYAAAARARSKLGDRAGARETIARGLRVAPDSPELLLEDGQPDRAIAALPRLGPGFEVTVRVRVLREKARSQRAAGDVEGAERTLAAALALVPDDREALDDAADLAMSRGRWRQALAYLEPLLERLSQRVDELGAAYRRKATAQRALADAAGAEATLRQALAQAPGDAQTLGQLVELELAQGHAAAALPDARRLLEAQARAAPADRAAAQVWLAKVQRALKDEAAAEAGLEAALALDGGSRDALAEMARLQSGRGRGDEALGYAKRLLSAIPDKEGAQRADAYLLQARLLRGRKDDAGAQASLERAVALAPASRGALMELIGLELERGEPRRALERARSLVTVSEGDGADARARADWRLAQAQRATGDAVGARESLERALALSPGEAEALSDLFELELGEGDARAADTLLAGHHPPADGRAQAVWLVRRGLARAGLGDAARARQDFHDAVQSDAEAACRGPGLPSRRDRLPPSYFDACLARSPTDAKLYVDRGLALFEAGRAEAAVTDFRRAVELAPDDAQAQLSLVSALSAQHRDPDALAAADRAMTALGSRRDPVTDELLALRDKLRAANAAPNKH